MKTPLNAIIGFSSLINSQAIGPIADSRYADYAALIQASGEHLLQLINDLLDVSKIEAGRFELQEEPVPLAALIAQTIDTVRLQAEAKALVLQIDPAAADIVIEADAKACRQILLNLLSNAVKFTPSGGAAGLKVAITPRGELALQIWDTGIGIPADALERVFAPFTRVHAQSHAIEGTGLGLSIARGLARLHGGTIAIDSKVGEGTTATFTLPASRIVSLRPPLAAAS